MFNGDKLIILLVIAVFVIGPERLPRYAEQLARLVKRARVFIQDAKTRVDEELGDDLSGVDWASLDPRKYDPRRIVRDALLDDLVPAATGAGSAAAVASVSVDASAPIEPAVDVVKAAAPSVARAPFDDEAT